jgi:hypothetical protein
MIKTFDTTKSASTSVAGGSTNTLVYVGLAALALYAGYRFWWKPMQDKKKLEAQK